MMQEGIMATRGWDYRADLRDFLINMVEMEATALRVGVTYWSKWATHVASYTDAMTELLVRMMRDPWESREMIPEAMNAYKKYLRDLAALPGQAVVDFNLELESIRRRSQAKAPDASK